ncbi:MAG: hypothetical protein ACP5RX_02515 [Minisyncoccia bacterium]
MVSSQELEWAVYIYYYIGGDGDKHGYIDTIINLQKLGLYNDLTNAWNKNAKNICDIIITFLNKWKTRTKKTTSKNLQEAIFPILENLSKLQKQKLESTNINSEMADNIKEIFDSINKVKNIGPTGTAKILGLLCPNMFVQWDKEIIKHFLDTNKIDGYAYLSFIDRMQKETKEILSQNTSIPKNLSDNLVKLYEQQYGDQSYQTIFMKTQGKSLAKYLDEYNWITITKGIKLPPKWYPSVD